MPDADGFLAAASAAGCPKDQVENFIIGGYCAQPKQMQFHAACRECDEDSGPVEVAFGGARGPGKSHAMLAQMVLDDCQRFPGLKCLLLRRVGRAVRESFEDMRSSVLGYTQHNYNRSSGLLSFPNSSKVVLGHFKDERDIDNYLGLEYDVIGVEEATTLSAQKYRAIRTCNRTSKAWRPRTYLNMNPGGIGHAWVKQRFVEPWRTKKQTTTRFIPATFRDNVFINAGYVDTLNSLIGWQKRAWKDGDWDIAAGQYFTNFSNEVHVVKPRPVEEWWPEVWLAGDYGWVHPTVVLLFAMDLESNVFIVDEYAASQRLPEAHAAGIREMLRTWKVRESRITRFPFGRDAWRRNERGRTVADSYAENGWFLDQANMDRLGGAAEVLRRLGDISVGIKPTLYIYNNCTKLIEQLPRLEHDPHRPEDVLKCNIDEAGTGGDDEYDALRYGLMAFADTPNLEYSAISFRR